jgi:hypothetical protein
MLQHLWTCLSNGGFTSVDHVAGGERFSCFGNVAKAISADGGSAVLGWAVQRGAPPAAHSSNRLANCYCETHCVWMDPDGRLLDLTDGYENSTFIHNPWGLVSNMRCFFVDYFGLTHLVPLSPYCHSLAVRLPRSPAWVPRPLRPVAGGDLARGLTGWRFSNDPGEQGEMADMLRRLQQKCGEEQALVGATSAEESE